MASQQTKMIEANDELHAQGLEENSLGLEIRFWRDLIDSLDDAANSRETTERMQQALALAEYRLACLYGNGRSN